MEGLSLWQIREGTWREGSLAGTLKVEGSANGHQLTWGPRWGVCRGLVYLGLDKILETGTFLHRGPVKYFGGYIHREL